MIKSLIKEITEINLPDIWITEELYMCPIILGDSPFIPCIPFKETIKEMLKYSPIKSGVAYVTIDQKELVKGQTHRRGGAHVDGNYLFNWSGGGGDWKCGGPGRLLSPEKQQLQYANKNGGFLMVSSYSACKAWSGEYIGEAGQGGDCHHIELDEGFLLKPNTIYLGNSTCIHESLPVKENVKRTLIRITLPATEEVL